MRSIVDNDILSIARRYAEGDVIPIRKITHFADELKDLFDDLIWTPAGVIPVRRISEQKIVEYNVIAYFRNESVGPAWYDFERNKWESDTRSDVLMWRKFPKPPRVAIGRL